VLAVIEFIGAFNIFIAAIFMCLFTSAAIHGYFKCWFNDIKEMWLLPWGVYLTCEHHLNKVGCIIVSVLSLLITPGAFVGGIVSMIIVGTVDLFMLIFRKRD